ncbi:MAG: hydroxyisourate hydrolase [Verrucomicrobia bacterium]|nr:hydroxyisourate hydrolase [Verrucomicrobiota bacterium]MDA1065717.1 hydroxyisourate hydrolase [Verrucomicrobiota bacterium]
MSAKLSTHVLNTKDGIPASGVKIELFHVTSEGEQLIISTTTNSDGRTDHPLLTGDQFKTGDYKLVFHIGEYFHEHAEDAPFLSEVPVQFRINDPNGSYHVPLLASPWSYSVYRGS